MLPDEPLSLFCSCGDMNWMRWFLTRKDPLFAWLHRLLRGLGPEYCGFRLYLQPCDPT